MYWDGFRDSPSIFPAYIIIVGHNWPDFNNWWLVTLIHIGVRERIIIGINNGLALELRQAKTWTMFCWSQLRLPIRPWSRIKFQSKLHKFSIKFGVVQFQLLAMSSYTFSSFPRWPGHRRIYLIPVVIRCSRGEPHEKAVIRPGLVADESPLERRAISRPSADCRDCPRTAGIVPANYWNELQPPECC